jgi:ABC-type transporter Mla subunit MlaD
MLNENDSNLKAHLKTLHRSLSETDEVDEELQMLLRQLDGDIKQVLERRADADLDAHTYGLGSRTQELSARFSARHPNVASALRELGNILSSMGI